MSPDRQKTITDYVANQLGSYRMWRTTILSGVGLVLCGVVAVILIGVMTSGSEGSDDVGLPAAFAAGLGLVCFGGLVYGVTGIRALATHELLVQLRLPTPTIPKVERIADAWGLAVRFHLPSGATYRIYFEPAVADEVGRWLDRPS